MHILTTKKTSFAKVLSVTLFSLTLSIITVVVVQHRTDAAPVVGFNAGNIIDDGIFTNANSMNRDQIQAFLNSKVANCDTNGAQQSEFGGGTRAQWAANASLHPKTGAQYPPFTCLKDYSVDGRSAAQLIYDTAQEFQINPQVLIVLLQKEQSLVTDTWPLSIQYRSATGYGCPDTADCDSQYYGLTNQIRWAARMFRSIMNNSSSWYTPYVLGNNYIRWSPGEGCGGSTVNIQNRATQALYNYTPYQPNQSALNAGYGMGDSCGAYGNRNFYLYFNDWFGSTKVYDPYGWEVIKTSTDSAEYLKVGNTKRWIPSGDIKNDWNLSSKSIRVVSQSELDSIPSIPTLDRLGLYDNKYWYVSGGKKYWLSNDDLLRAYGQIDNRALAAPAYIPLSTIPNGGEATFYVSAPGNKVARIMNGQLYVINSADADRWQANPIAISTANFNSLSVAGTTDYRVSINGTRYLVDNGRLLNINDASLTRDFNQSSATFMPIPSDITRYLPTISVSSLVRTYEDGAYYVLRGGVRYYIPTGSHASDWSLPTNPTFISSRLATSFTTSNIPLPLIISDSTTGKYYLLDGSRHELIGAMFDSVKNSSTTIPAFNSDYINALPQGTTISSPILQISGQPHLYTIMSGQLYHIPTNEVLNALGSPTRFSIALVSSDFIQALNSTILPASQFIVKDGVTYFQQDGYVFPIDSASKSDWLSGKSPMQYNGTGFGVSRFFAAGATPLTQFVQEGDQKYIISNGTAFNVTSAQSSFTSTGKPWVPVSIFGMNREAFTSYAVKDSTSNAFWLITSGVKQAINSSNVRQSYAKAGNIISLSPNVLSQYAQVNNGVDPSLLITAPGKGIKLLDASGRYYEFPSSDTANNYMVGKVVQSVSLDLFNNFSQSRGPVSRLVKDPSGKIYWIEAGTKRWISNGTAFQRYAGNPIVDMDIPTLNFFTEGQAIN